MRWNKVFAESKNPLIFFALSSFFLLISLSLVAFKDHPDLWKIVFAFPFCFLICFKSGTKGLIAALIIFAISVSANPFLHGIWGICFVISVAISFFLVTYTSEETLRFYLVQKEAYRLSEDAVRQLQDQLKETLSFSIQEEKEVQKKLEEAQKELLLSKKEKESLVQELSQIKEEMFQMTLFKDAYEKQIMDHCAKEKVLSDKLQKVTEALQHVKASKTEKQEIDERLKMNSQLYKQLRDQFEEKSEMLHQTRKELFEVEGKLIALQKESEQKVFDFHPEACLLFEQLKEVEKERQDLEAEVEDLQGLVSSLFPKKKTAKPKNNTAKKETNAVDLELNFH